MHFWKEYPQQLMFSSTLGTLKPSEPPSGHSCPPQLQLGRHKDGQVPERVSGGSEGFLGGVPLTTIVLYDPLGVEEPSGTPSGPSCPPQLQLGRHKDGQVPDRVSRGIEAFLGGVPLTSNVLYDLIGTIRNPIRTLLSSTTPTGEA